MGESGDSESIKGLPVDWLAGDICVSRLCDLFKAKYADTDPAPWHEVVNADHMGSVFAQTPEEYAFNDKLFARLVATVQKAVFSGKLTPSWFDGSAFKSIPAQAFGNWRIVLEALWNGRFEVDPLWPDEWQHWSNHYWAIPKEQFEAWMQSDHALSITGLPVPDSEIPPCDVVAIASRKPSDAARVPLSEAITWIAFGIALDAKRLSGVMSWKSLAGGDLQAAQLQMEKATAELLSAGADGLVPLYGRPMEAYGERGKRTEKIDPLTLEDYRKALIFGHDSLHYGVGLFLKYDTPKVSHALLSERHDHFANVTVDRDALLKRFGSRQDSTAALLMPIPAALPDVGAVMGLEEAVCLIAYNRPSYDIEVWEDRAGNIKLVDPSRAAIASGIEEGKPRHHIILADANRQLWRALQDGTLQGLIALADGPVLSVSRYYWNQIDPESLEYIYRGMSNSDSGRGCPVLLSRRAFEDWRAAIKCSVTAEIDRAPSVILKRKRPGPARNPVWEPAIDSVTKKCISKGYAKPLKRGQKANIQRMLSEYLAEKDIHYSEDTVRVRSGEVIDRLPKFPD